LTRLPWHHRAEPRLVWAEGKKISTIKLPDAPASQAVSLNPFLEAAYFPPACLLAIIPIQAATSKDTAAGSALASVSSQPYADVFKFTSAKHLVHRLRRRRQSVSS
jgi:hypothetical protein